MPRKTPAGAAASPGSAARFNEAAARCRGKRGRRLRRLRGGLLLQ